MTKDEAIHKALKVLNCLNNDRVYETAWVKGAINACEEALKQPIVAELNDEYLRDTNVIGLEQPAEPRLVSYAPDGSTCTLNIDGEEVYFNREQPAQEPVFWMHEVEEAPFEGHQVTVAPEQDDYYTIPLYTHPHQWVGLTDDEIIDIYFQANIYPQPHGFIIDFVRAIEQALKEKNHG